MKVTFVRFVVICLIITFHAISSYSQTNFQNFLNAVNIISDSISKIAIIDSFMNYARTLGIPYIENSTANFIFRGAASKVNLSGDFNGWDASNILMSRLPQTNFFYYSKVFEINARLDYKFILNASTWILDPENPNIVAGGFGPNSELAMPQYIQPWEIKYKAGINHGTLLTRNVLSVNTASNYWVSILLPFGYDTTKSYPTVYFQDGSEYISLGRAVDVIDNLIDADSIEDVIAVFVTPNNRNEEYAGSKRNQYRLFFVNELVPYIDSNYTTAKSPLKRLVLGDSFGGNISALISYNHPDVFGNCGLHSGAFWPNNYEAYNLIVNGVFQNIKFCSVWGTYESLFTNMRSFSDSLQNKGYQQKWIELPEGHSWGLWRANIDFLLTYFFPKVPSEIKDEIILPAEFVLYQNYPNPFNPTTILSFVTNHQSFVSLKVYDVLGNDVATLVDGYKPAGTYEVEFTPQSRLSSGVYFYQLKIGSFIQTKKMILIN